MTLLAARKQPVMLTEKQVVEMIRAKQDGRSLREYASTVGVSAAYLADIYSGKRNPGQKVLNYFGIRKTKKVTFEYVM